MFPHRGIYASGEGFVGQVNGRWDDVAKDGSSVGIGKTARTPKGIVTVYWVCEMRDKRIDIGMD